MIMNIIIILTISQVLFNEMFAGSNHNNMHCVAIFKSKRFPPKMGNNVFWLLNCLTIIKRKSKLREITSRRIYLSFLRNEFAKIKQIKNF